MITGIVGGVIGLLTIIGYIVWEILKAYYSPDSKKKREEEKKRELSNETSKNFSKKNPKDISIDLNNLLNNLNELRTRSGNPPGSSTSK